jgi:integrase
MIKKRGKGYGVRIYRGGGRYEWTGTYPTRREARAAEAAAMSVEETSVSPQTVGEYAETWLAGYEQRVKRSTYDRAAVAARRVAAHELATAPIDAVPMAVADAFVKAYPASVQTAVTIFNHAIARGACRVNPFRGLARKGSGRKHLLPMTVDQVSELAEAARGAHVEPFSETLRALVIFAAYSGMRPGELHALEWRDIDRDANRVTVRRRLYQGRIDLPKANRVREIVLLPDATDALDTLPRKREGLVFRAKRGGQITEPLMSASYWPPVRALFGRLVDFYELRHFCGHHLYVTLGLPARVVAAQLGHSSPRLVEDLYGHGDVGALEEIDRAVGRSPARLSVVRDASQTQGTAD